LERIEGKKSRCGLGGKQLALGKEKKIATRQRCVCFSSPPFYFDFFKIFQFDHSVLLQNITFYFLKLLGEKP